MLRDRPSSVMIEIWDAFEERPDAEFGTGSCVYLLPMPRGVVMDRSSP
jgi:hypothetical protein